MILPSEVFSGIPLEGVLEAEPRARLPVGFDAVAQFSRKLLQASLDRVLQANGMSSIEIRRALGSDELPPSVHSALSALPSPGMVSVGAEFAVEFRLTGARLRTLGERTVPPVIVAAAARTAGSTSGLSPKAAEIAWTVEFSLLRIEHERILDPGPRSSDSGPRTSARVLGDIVGSFGDLLLNPDFESFPESRLTRTVLAKGVAVTHARTVLVPRLDLLQIWLEFDLATSTTVVESSDPLISDLLASSVGESWFQATASRLASAARLRACPRVALGGALSAGQIAGLGLTSPRGDYLVHRLPNGAEILSLAANFGADAGGLIAEVQPFIGLRDFALFVSRTIISPVVRTRWRSNPAARQFTSNVTIRMPISEGSETLGDGTVRVRVRLGELTEARLMAAVSPQGDVLRLSCDEVIEVLRVWWPSGEEVQDLGELGEPATAPMTVNIAPFANPVSGTDLDLPFRQFLLSVLEPLAAPLIDRFPIHGMSGFISEARDASVCRWSLPRLFDIVSGGLPDLELLET